nr:DUF3761 domain-containing protein [Mycolicibacterium holsaticum]
MLGAAFGFAPTLAAPPQTAVLACPSGYYENVDNQCVPLPGNDSSGATALCEDGSYSYSRNRSGTCSGHGGVARWL